MDNARLLFFLSIISYYTGAEHHLLGMHIGVLFAWSAFGFVVSIPGWYWNVGEKVIRSSMPMFFEAFEHMSHMM